jgi:hypothetical protein
MSDIDHRSLTIMTAAAQGVANLLLRAANLLTIAAVRMVNGCTAASSCCGGGRGRRWLPP